MTFVRFTSAYNGVDFTKVACAVTTENGGGIFYWDNDEDREWIFNNCDPQVKIVVDPEVFEMPDFINHPIKYPYNNCINKREKK